LYPFFISLSLAVGITSGIFHSYLIIQSYEGPGWLNELGSWIT